MRYSVLVASFAACFAVSAYAQTERLENGSRFGGWTVSCEAIAVNETLCILSQRLVRTDTNTVLAELIAFNSDNAGGAWIAARVPNGVFFPSGFVIGRQEADTRLEFEWQNCSADICEALLELGPEELDLIDNAEDWVAGYRPEMTSESLVFRVSLDGLEDGLLALARALGQPGPRADRGASDIETGASE